MVVANALRQCVPEFLVNSAKTNFFAKFIAERQDPDTFERFRLATKPKTVEQKKLSPFPK
ncbi:hypothetical protein AWV80_28790 [Cupriavidus sp. UYMU48A]|nr:hypothetical protein AWV80_28790 [Cupriavidus sp. UYMU48A]